PRSPAHRRRASRIRQAGARTAGETSCGGQAVEEDDRDPCRGGVMSLLRAFPLWWAGLAAVLLASSWFLAGAGSVEAPELLGRALGHLLLAAALAGIPALVARA